MKQILICIEFCNLRLPNFLQATDARLPANEIPRIRGIPRHTCVVLTSYIANARHRWIKIVPDPKTQKPIWLFSKLSISLAYIPCVVRIYSLWCVCLQNSTIDNIHMSYISPRKLQGNCLPSSWLVICATCISIMLVEQDSRASWKIQCTFY